MCKNETSEKESMHMYEWYQDFYRATKVSKAYAKYCEMVFGKNFSQHGFSDIKQLNKLLEVTAIKEGDIVLDLGCGNGLMAEYVSDITKAHVYGVDYSAEAIKQAIERTIAKKNRLTFEEGCVGIKKFPEGFFDVIISIDSIFFGKNMIETLKRLKESLKPTGKMAIFYSEFIFDENKPLNKLKANNTELAKALNSCKLNFETFDFTKEHYLHMQCKKQAVQSLKCDFEAEGNTFLYKNINEESVDSAVSFESFQKFSSRYLYYVQV